MLILRLSLFLLVATWIQSHILTHATHDVWAVLVDTSRYWFNYRHATDTIAIYQTLRKLGVSDSHIILMIADQPECNSRNPYPGQLYMEESREYDLMPCDTRIDYSGKDVTPETFLDLLRGRMSSSSHRRNILNSNDKSKVFIYMNGHSGDRFFKFHDRLELMAETFGSAIVDMALKRRYGELVIVWDTCEAATMWEALPHSIAPATLERSANVKFHSAHDLPTDLSFWDAPLQFIVSWGKALLDALTQDEDLDVINRKINQHTEITPASSRLNITSIGTSVRGENSYAEGMDSELALATRDEFAKATVDYFLKRIIPPILQHHTLKRADVRSYLAKSDLESNVTEYENALRTVFNELSRKNRKNVRVSVLDWLRKSSPRHYTNGLLGIRTDLSPVKSNRMASTKTSYAGATNKIPTEAERLLSAMHIVDYFSGFGAASAHVEKK